MLTFYSFMSPDELLSALEERCDLKIAVNQCYMLFVARFNVQPSEELTESEMEIFQMDIALPIQLRLECSH